MVRRTPDTDDRGAPCSMVLGVDALDHLGRLEGLMAFLLERRGGYPSPLEARVVSEGRWANPATALMWDRLVGAISVTAHVLENILRETGEEEPPHSGLGFLARWLREGESQLLRDVRGLWQQTRARLRPYLLARVRLDDTADLAPIERAVRACWASPSEDSDGQRLMDGLRGVLLGLVLHAGTERTREDLRCVLWDAATTRVPRRARYTVARALVHGLAKGSGQSIEKLVFLGDTADPAPPPTGHAHAALLLLAALDVVETGGAPGLLQRMRSAYGLLRKQARAPAMAPGLHEAAEAVTAPPLHRAAVPDVVGLALQATAGWSVPDRDAVDPGPPDARRADDEESPRRDRSGPRLGREVSSPAPADLPPTHGKSGGGAGGASIAGDETHAPPRPDSSAPAGVSSSRAVAGPPVGQDVGNAYRGGDGTETSKAPFSAAPSEVSSPTSPVPLRPRQRPEDLALAFLTHELRHGHPVPSLAKCAGVAGVTKQATANWSDFMLVWRNAKATRGGRIRRGYRRARTGDIETESDDG